MKTYTKLLCFYIKYTRFFIYGFPCYDINVLWGWICTSMLHCALRHLAFPTVFSINTANPSSCLLWVLTIPSPFSWDTKLKTALATSENHWSQIFAYFLISSTHPTLPSLQLILQDYTFSGILYWTPNFGIGAHLLLPPIHATHLAQLIIVVSGQHRKIGS